MQIFEAVRVALQMIWAQKLKSGFSIIGVFMGVTFLIAVWTVIEGMNQYMESRFATLLGANTFQVRRSPEFQAGDVPRETWMKWRRHPLLTYDDARALEARFETDVVTAWESDQNSNVDFDGNVATGIRIIGATAPYFDAKGLKIEDGRPFSPQEVNAGSAVVVIGKDLATGLFASRDPLGREVKIQGIPYRVIGVVESQGNIFGMSLDKFAVAPAFSPVKRFINPPNTVDILIVKTNTVEEMRRAMSEATAIMRSRRGLRPDEENNFSVETTESILAFWDQIKGILFLAGPMLVMISLVVGGIVIMNIMLMSVAERTFEIGIRKSLGARKRDILRQFVVESATLSVVGAGLGIVTGLAAAAAIEAFSPMPASVSPVSIVIGVTIGAGVGIVAGAYPAWRASRLDPVEAMRNE